MAAVNVLVHDTEQVRKFYDLFYKDKFGDDIVYMIMLVSRSKYFEADAAAARIKDGMFARKTIKHDDFDEYMRMIYQYENNPASLVGSNGQHLPCNCLCVYATLNPRSAYTALNAFNARMTAVISQQITACSKGGNTFTWANSEMTNICSILNTCVQNAAHKKLYIQVDLDIKTYFQDVHDYLATHGIVPMCIIETRGGYHFILKNDTLTTAQKREVFTGYLTTLKHDSVDRTGVPITKNVVDIISGNPMSPICGTIQGGFNVRFVDV